MQKIQSLIKFCCLLIKSTILILDASGIITDSTYITIFLDCAYDSIDYFLIHFKSIYIMLRAKL